MKDMKEGLRNKEEVISFSFSGKVYQEIIPGNIELKDLTPNEVRQALNRSNGRIAFYANLRADSKYLEEKEEMEFESWRIQRFFEIDADSETKKKSDTWKREKVILENDDTWRGYQYKLQRIRRVNARILAILRGFEGMQKTLCSVLSSMRSEMESIAKGYGDISDIS